MTLAKNPGGRRTPGRKYSLVGVCLTTAVVLAGCGQGSAPTAQPSVPAHSTAVPAAIPDGQCGDSQSGRYVVESFSPTPVMTVTFTGDLQADVYQPADDPAACRVGVIWVHGGGFTQATRNGPAEQAWGAALAGRGFVLVAIDYRLGSGEPFGLDQATDPDRVAVVSDAIADATAAVRWLRTSASQWRVDPDRLVIGGTSAGAMTALGAALTNPNDDRPSAVVSIAGDLDSEWVGPTHVPALLVHGDADILVPYRSSVDAMQTLTAAGGQAQLVTISGAGHEITGVPPVDVIDAVARWIHEAAAAGCG